MKIGDKVIVNENGFLEFVGHRGTIVEEYISNSQWAMLCGVSKWVVKFDQPVNIRKEAIVTCVFKESELTLVDDDTVYEVIAYDKDADVDVSLHKTKDYGDARSHALKFGEQCRRDLLLNHANGQTFDWIKLVDANNWDVVYWASYKR